MNRMALFAGGALAALAFCIDGADAGTVTVHTVTPKVNVKVATQAHPQPPLGYVSARGAAKSSFTSWRATRTDHWLQATYITAASRRLTTSLRLCGNRDRK